MKRREFIAIASASLYQRDTKIAEHNRITTKLNKLGAEAVKTIEKVNTRKMNIVDASGIDRETLAMYRKLADLYREIGELFLQLAAL